MLTEVTVWLPPQIAELRLPLAPELSSTIEQAVRDIAVLDSGHGKNLNPLGVMLLRTESVASSKIEHVEADVSDYARALHGMKSNPSAVSMANATVALDHLIGSVHDGAEVTLDAILRAHKTLMSDDPSEAAYAGRVRGVQNWIGGSDHAPRNALYVPPPPETVDAYLDDLIRFINRTDLSAMAQAAIAHAQFESIHPFTDGNGRIGRALVNTVFRRRGVTEQVVVPLASALVARKDDYFDLLTDYRLGHPEPIIAAFARASAIAARESRATAARMEDFPQGWRDAVGTVRAGSSVARLLELLPQAPVFSAEEAEAALGVGTSALYRGVDRLVQAGVLRPLTTRKRNQVWGVGDTLDELDDLSSRIGLVARQAPRRARVG